METLPYVAVAGLYVAARLLLGGRAAAPRWRPASVPPSPVAAAVAFVATVPASAWLSAACDAYSIPQFAIAAIAGAGLAVAAGLEPLHRRFATRLFTLAVRRHRSCRNRRAVLSAMPCRPLCRRSIRG